MSKYKAPAPSLADAYRWLPFTSHGPLSLRTCLYPTPENGKVYVCVECLLIDLKGRFTVWRRWGEQVSVHSDDAVKGALMRACVHCSGWFEGKALDEVVKLAQWDVSMLQ